MRRLGMAILAVLAQSACLQEPKEPLRIGVNAWPPFELLYLAREQGFFRDEGVEVDLVDFSSYTGILRSYHQGNIDGFLATLNEIQIADNFQDLPAVVMVADYSFGGDALVVCEGVPDLDHLRGRRIAFEESALGSYVLERILEAGGLRPGDVHAVNRLPEEAENDFVKGTVDGVVTYEPSLGRLLREKGAHVLLSSRDLPGEIADVMAVRRAVLDSRSDDVRRVLKAWFRAVAYLNEHREAAAAEMAKRLNVSVEEFLQGLRGAHIPDLEENRALMGDAQAPGPLHHTADRLGSFLLQRGLAKKTAAAADLIHPGLVRSL